MKANYISAQANISEEQKVACFDTVITLSWSYSSYGYLKYILSVGVKGENKSSEHFLSVVWKVTK